MDGPFCHNLLPSWTPPDLNRPHLHPLHAAGAAAALAAQRPVDGEDGLAAYRLHHGHLEVPVVRSLISN